MKTILQRYEAIKERIAEAASRAGREPSEIVLVAAAKTVSPEKVREAIEAGVNVLGENYVQEGKKVQEAIDLPARWHLIGRLQRNKVKQAVKFFDVIETIDRQPLVEEIQRCAIQAGKRLELLIQVNLSGEISKSGVKPDEVLPIINSIAASENLCCTGLMTLPPFFDDPERARPYFSELRQLRDSLQPIIPSSVHLHELSMGMSGDFEVAIEEGATLVRIGSALFGSRGA